MPLHPHPQADVLNVPVQRPADLETTAKGAAVAAGIGSGMFSGVEEVSQLAMSELTTIEPTMADEERAKWVAGWDDATQRTLNLA